jgi:hypothetical protein
MELILTILVAIEADILDLSNNRVKNIEDDATDLSNRSNNRIKEIEDDVTDLSNNVSEI